MNHQARKQSLFVIASVALGFLMLVQDAYSQGARATQEKTPVENSQSLPRPPAGSLGTSSYEPTAIEKPFFSKLPGKEQTTGSMFDDYSITGKTGTHVGWFGIVRKIEENATTLETKILVEMKYFDGLTDTHIMALSFNGGGDFMATLGGVGLGIKPLSLVKVYGIVEREDKSIPMVKAEYVRHWDWGQFTFLMVYGKQKGNTEWKKLNKADENRIYNPFPTPKYYEDRLGPRPQP
jgi:hypothetical protein